MITRAQRRELQDLIRTAREADNKLHRLYIALKSTEAERGDDEWHTQLEAVHTAQSNLHNYIVDLTDWSN